ncbi:MAG: polymorphic toxin type 44 domain-containing protein [Clostridiaceae bacterium]
MRKITLPVSNPKKTLSGDLLKETVHKALAADTLKTFDAADRPGQIPAGAETDAGTNGESSKLNPTQQRDAAVVAKLPSGFPIQNWDSMSYKAQLQAMKFSGLTEQEQWQLLNPTAPLGVLDAANRERYRPVTTTGADKDPEILTNPSKTPYLQNGQSDGQLGKGKGIAGGAAPKKVVRRNDALMSISKYPAIAQLIDVDHITPKQGAVLAKAQIKLTALGMKGEPMQQEVDNILADACTKMLTDANRPENDFHDLQEAIPAYTDAVNDLFMRLRADGAVQKEELDRISSYSGMNLASVYSRLISQLIEFKEANGEKGVLNLRNETQWKALIENYSPEAVFLKGSQYCFVYDGNLLSVEDLGNIVFGYYGSAMGLPTDVLYIGAGYAAVKKAVEEHTGTWLDFFGEYMGDSPEDRAAINMGISWYLEGK